MNNEGIDIDKVITFIGQERYGSTEIAKQFRCTVQKMVRVLRSMERTGTIKKSREKRHYVYFIAKPVENTPHITNWNQQTVHDTFRAAWEGAR